jgi:hypothetical protein
MCRTIPTFRSDWRNSFPLRKRYHGAFTLVEVLVASSISPSRMVAVQKGKTDQYTNNAVSMNVAAQKQTGTTLATTDPPTGYTLRPACVLRTTPALKARVAAAVLKGLCPRIPVGP